MLDLRHDLEKTCQILFRLWNGHAPSVETNSRRSSAQTFNFIKPFFLFHPRASFTRL